MLSPTCIEPGNVPEQNYVDPEADQCWLNWKEPPQERLPADKQIRKEGQKVGILVVAECIHLNF